MKDCVIHMMIIADYSTADKVTHHITVPFPLVSSFHGWYMLVKYSTVFFAKVTHIFNVNGANVISKTSWPPIFNPTFLLTVRNSHVLFPMKCPKHFSERPPSVLFLWYNVFFKLLRLTHLANIWTFDIFILQLWNHGENVLESFNVFIQCFHKLSDQPKCDVQ